MALIKMTAIVDAISGKIQGTVFARNKGGAYARGRGVVTNPRTPEQMRVRSIFGTVSASWRNLSVAQISDWDNLASETTYQNRLGDTRNYSGKALFQKVNQNRILAGYDLLKDAPNFADLIGISYASGTGISEEGTVSIGIQAGLAADPVANNVNAGFILSATGPVNQGTKFVKNRLRDFLTILDLEKNVIDTEDFAVDEEALGALYTAKYGIPEPGERVAMALTPVNDLGQKGAPFVFFIDFT